MADQEYIVLRRQNPMVPEADNLGMRGGTRGGMRGFAVEPETLEIAKTALTKAERDDLRRDPRTSAIAPPMPLTLIEPTASAEAGPAEAPNQTWGVRAVHAPDSPFTGTGITVAVLDTGIDPNHPAFQGVNLVQRNFTTEGDDDQNGHGTHCAGTIFGQDVGNLRIGVARNVRRALIGKVLGAGGGSSADLAKAILWAVHEGAHVVSMSLGIDFPGFVDFLIKRRGMDPRPATSMALEAYRANVNLFSELADFVKARGAFEQGTVIVAASGNESRRNDFEIAVAPPAAGTGVIAVGALEQSANGFAVADFSNDQVNISAPGVDVVSAFPGQGLRTLSGTSMATPHVAGVAALWAQKLREENGRVDNVVLTAQLLASGDRAPLVAGSQADDVGTGIVQAPLQ